MISGPGRALGSESTLTIMLGSGLGLIKRFMHLRQPQMGFLPDRKIATKQ